MSINHGLFYLLQMTLCIRDFGWLQIDGLGRCRTPLLADNARCCHSPRQTSPAIQERRAQTDGLCVARNPRLPALLFRRDLPDRTGRTNLRAQHATALAVANPRHHDRRPETFQTRFCQRGLQRVVGADLHALTAPYAARQEVLFVQCARRTQQPLMALDCKSGRAAQERNHDCPRRQSGEHLASLQVHTDGLLGGEKLELQAVLRTLINTVQTEMTLRLAPRNSADRIVAALAAQQAAIAVLAALRALDQSENRPARYDPEQSAQWAKCPAPETSHEKIT